MQRQRLRKRLLSLQPFTASFGIRESFVLPQLMKVRSIVIRFGDLMYHGETFETQHSPSVSNP